MKKPGRNDPCPCGSGKKFKKCCENKMIAGRFKATKIAPASSKLTSLFQSTTTAIPKKTTPPPEQEKPPEEPKQEPSLEEKDETQ